MSFRQLNSKYVSIKQPSGVNPCEYMHMLKDCEACFHNYAYILRNNNTWKVLNTWRIKKILNITYGYNILEIIETLTTHDILLEFMKGRYYVNPENVCDFILYDYQHENGFFECAYYSKCVHRDHQQETRQAIDYDDGYYSVTAFGCRKYHDWEVGESDIALTIYNDRDFVRYLMEHEGLYTIQNGEIVYNLMILDALELIGMKEDIPF